ncbi:MAG: bifunctional UDP-N-acetylglucosamine diphosphorylase/glucosamine-1-phosphate N-acetyltransferase GlmU [Peptostreptococcaceae bacterium]|nr:bifunctional UDP-N-acetylglucosamine diphosphorylase/glucosamine-1-phosphate N-acetyltransferase GlmU [Peptostreptococcaceae bacterium]
MSLRTVILAAGQGTRMKSSRPKVLHEIAGLPMIDHVIEESRDLSKQRPVVVVGHQADLLEAHLGDRAETVLQSERLGTGHAVMMAADRIVDGEDVLVLCGDTPLIRRETLKEMAERRKEGFGAVVLSAFVEDPTGYGRILRDEKGDFLKIREQKDASEEERAIREINAGMYVFEGRLLKENLKKLRADNAQKEYYLTDVLEHILRSGRRIAVCEAPQEEILGVNSRKQLAEAEREMRLRINYRHMQKGVTLIDPESTYIEKNVRIGADTLIYPNCHLRGETVLGEGCIIRENTTIEDSVLGDFVEVRNSTILKSRIGDETTIGPYAYLRPKSVLGKKVRIGDFVEVKNAEIGEGSKASHLSYIGDATVGKDVNIGCGVVFVNYDGVKKYQSVVRDKAFIGSNSNLVAPVLVEEGAYIATGSTVTIDVPANALCIARARETLKKDWRLKR